MIRPSSSDAPSVSTCDMNGPIWRGGKLTTATTSRPSSSSRAYSVICADERLTPISGPKSIVSFQAGLRASGKSSTAVTRPTRMSTARNWSKSISGVLTRPAAGR